MAVWYTFHRCLFLLSLVCAAIADDDNLWIYPTEPGPSNNFVANPSFTLGSKQTIEWTTTLDSYYIALFQQQIDPASGIQIETIYSVSGSGSGDQTFKWPVQTYDADRTKSPVYFFWINPGSSTGFTSHYFNISEGDTASAVASSATTTSSTVSQSTTSSTTPSSTTPSSTTSTTSNTAARTLVTSARPTATTPPSTSSTAAGGGNTTSNSPDVSIIKVALGVGLGLGIPLVLFAGIWIGLKAVRQRRPSSRSGYQHYNDQNAISQQGGGGEGREGWPMVPLPGGVDQKSTPVVEAPYFQSTAEAPGDLPPPAELDSGHHRWI
ncbi:hypothetical protein B0J12DRAFT_724609 [Macrophomina phaseolina]|uniref:Mid2 domain-containing protein n=1 Tax=Macrophomina phaseolina TaxID=35725 RepID=A0ABQ8GQY5_9PEZI|nr:hypothetical protein B0J12DRAFT_724609 [Macrophomina phaseolina]